MEKSELSREDKERLLKNYAIADKYWKSVLAERERKAAIIKAQKYLADFRSGKIADKYWKSVLAERKAAISKAQKHLADFKSGKIAGGLV
jgi:hypothetical protein